MSTLHTLQDHIKSVQTKYINSNKPWIIFLDNNKSSIVTTSLIYMSLKKLDHTELSTPIYFLTKNNSVSINNVLSKSKTTNLNTLINKDKLPFITTNIYVGAHNSFLLNVLGRGRPLPTNNTKWCNESNHHQPLHEFKLRNNIDEAIIIQSNTNSSTEPQKHSVLHKIETLSIIAGWSQKKLYSFLYENRSDPIIELLNTNSSVKTCESNGPKCSASNEDALCWLCPLTENKDCIENALANTSGTDLDVSELINTRESIIAANDSSSRINLAENSKSRITRITNNKIDAAYRKMIEYKKISLKMHQSSEEIALIINSLDANDARRQELIEVFREATTEAYDYLTKSNEIYQTIKHFI